MIYNVKIEGGRQYNPESMPYELTQADRKLDAAVEKGYGRKFADEADRVAFLFEKYKSL